MIIHATSGAGGRSPRLLTYTRACDARTFVTQTHMSPVEGEKLERILDRLADIGAVALYDPATPMTRADGLDATLGLLQRNLGSCFVDAAAGAARFPFTPTPGPQTLIALWPFEADPTEPDALAAHGLLFGLPIVFEALRVEDNDLAEPVPSVANRFQAWRSAMQPGATPGTAALPNAEGAYAVYAALQAG
jgi:hypothetical protein